LNTPEDGREVKVEFIHVLKSIQSYPILNRISKVNTKSESTADDLDEDPEVKDHFEESNPSRFEPQLSKVILNDVG
jgi:hypothetical protein